MTILNYAIPTSLRGRTVTMHQFERKPFQPSGNDELNKLMLNQQIRHDYLHAISLTNVGELDYLKKQYSFDFRPF